MTHLSSAVDFTEFLSIAIDDAKARRPPKNHAAPTALNVKHEDACHAGVWHRFLSADEAGAGSHLAVESLRPEESSCFLT